MIDATDNGSTLANAVSNSSIPDSPSAIAPVEWIASAVMEQIRMVSKNTSNAPHTLQDPL